MKPFDLVTIPSWTWHQFRATDGEPLGFLCMVNAERDRPQLPTPETGGAEESRHRGILRRQVMTAKPPAPFSGASMRAASRPSRSTAPR